MKALVFGVKPDRYEVPDDANALMQGLARTPVKLMDVDDPVHILAIL